MEFLNHYDLREDEYYNDNQDDDLYIPWSEEFEEKDETELFGEFVPYEIHSNTPLCHKLNEIYEYISDMLIHKHITLNQAKVMFFYQYQYYLSKELNEEN